MFRRFFRERFPEDVTQEYVEKWRSRGVPEEIISKAVDWARHYAEGIVGIITAEPYERGRLIAMAMPKALEKAEKWIEGVME